MWMITHVCSAGKYAIKIFDIRDREKWEGKGEGKRERKGKSEGWKGGKK